MRGTVLDSVAALEAVMLHQGMPLFRAAWQVASILEFIQGGCNMEQAAGDASPSKRKGVEGGPSPALDMGSTVKKRPAGVPPLAGMAAAGAAAAAAAIAAEASGLASGERHAFAHVQVGVRP